MKLIISISGILLLIFQHYIHSINIEVQFIIFLSGIILLGIPHGAADLLVATKNSESQRKLFSKPRFFINYLSRLGLFGLIIWVFPLAGNLLFILLAAYHFGETDLHQFTIDGIAGKFFVISYGLVILAVILLNHFEEVKPLFGIFDSGAEYASFINWLDRYRYTIMSCCGLLFFVCTFVYFLFSKTNIQTHGQFIVQFAFLLFILYNLPMVLGFTFYFVVWHSLLSLRNIIGYLRNGGISTAPVVAKQVFIYSLLAIAGICLFGITGFMFASSNAMMMYIFLGLAVLTAPHMQVMHNMYRTMRGCNKEVQTA
jgi:beta-carotene 15,15'-dioxygenase